MVSGADDGSSWSFAALRLALVARFQNTHLLFRGDHKAASPFARIFALEQLDEAFSQVSAARGVNSKKQDAMLGTQFEAARDGKSKS